MSDIDNGHATEAGANPRLIAVIIAYNEAVHLARCLASVQAVTRRILVVDSGSTDSTVDIARSYGASVLQHDWLNYSTQYNWALDQVRDQSDWVMRIDADEVLSEDLVRDIRQRLAGLSPDVHGVFVTRRIQFMGRMLRYGGVSSRALRIFRNGSGRCESRWMDEHIKVAGKSVRFRGEIHDINLKPLDWWIQKHNAYASREAIDLLNLRLRFAPLDSVGDLRADNRVGVKRWIKEALYARIPSGYRAFMFFVYRYFFRLGFLDGSAGAAFHILQGFWFRYLCDLKVREVERHMEATGDGVVAAIDKVLGIRVQRLSD